MAKKAQATWGGRFSAGPAELMLRFSESVSFDRRLAPFDIAGSKAHSAMLAQVGLITRRERDAIHRGLDAVGRDIAAGKFPWSTKLEDVHMNIEQALTRRVPAAAKLHTARSRNDQVATDMRLYFKAACAEIIGKLTAAQRAILKVAAQNRDVLIPGYTHLQRAQPVFLAHHLFTYLEMLQRDAQRFAVVADHANWCPLGSGAIAGTTLPIDREFTAKTLGFVDSAGRPRVTQNSMDAVSDRDVFIEFASACALTGVHFSRMAEDLILWASQEFKFVELPDAFCTGSSLMPQKKNPDSAELLRGKSARLQGNLHTLLVLAKGLPLTYNRDLQEDKPPLFDSFETVELCLELAAPLVAGAKLNREGIAAKLDRGYLDATTLMEYLIQKGIAQRTAHHLVGSLVNQAMQQGVSLAELPLETLQAAHPELDEGVRKFLGVENAVAAFRSYGSSAPVEVRRQIERWRGRLYQ